MKDQRNRRRHPRLKIDIPVVIEYQSESFDDCRMLNFSRGGVYLCCSDTRLNEALPHGYISEADREEILLNVPQESQQVPARVVYFDHGGLGLSFTNDSGIKLYESLYSHNQAPGPDSEIRVADRHHDPKQQQDLLNQIKKLTKPYLEHGLNDFFSVAQKELQKVIFDTVDPQEQSGLFFALNSLEKDQRKLNQEFIEQFEHGFNDLIEGNAIEAAASSDNNPELSLVETQEIETWILVNDVARRAESEVSRPLYHIETALSHLCHSNVHNELNPIAPISLLTIFKNILDGYQFDTKITRILLIAFRSTLLNGLNRFYENLLKQINKAHIDGLENQAQGAWTIIKSSDAPSIQNTPIDHLSKLSNLHPDSDAQEPTQGMSDDERKEVMTSLASLSRLQAATLQQQIENMIQEESSKPIQLSAEARAAIGAGEELVATLSEDPLITDQLRELMGSLKFLIIEAVLQDTSLLENSDHPVRRLLDTIECLKPYVNRGNQHSLLRDRDTQQLIKMTEAVESGKFNHVGEVSSELERLLSEQRSRFEANRKLSISRCLKDEKLRRAQLTTYQALSKALLNQTISPIVDKLFRFGWVNLMVQTAVLEKADEKGWQGYLQIVELLHRIFSDKPGKHQLTTKQQQAMMTMIRKGFTDYPIYAEQAKSFEQELQRLLEIGAEGDQFPDLRIDVNEAYLHHYFQGMNIDHADHGQSRTDVQWRHTVNKIELDTWLVKQNQKGQLNVLSLAWKNPQTDRYLLVDGDGFKALDESLDRLASRFADQQIRVMESSAKPIVERTIETMLANSYSDFKQESEIDSLTGLYNRRAFEAEVSKYLNQTETDSGILLQIDLDRFQVVNDLCGFEGGDKLLQTVTDILLSYLPEGGALGRIGDDEFSLLLKQESLEAGYQAAEMLRQTIDETAFDWQGRMIPTTASVGIVEIDSSDQKADKLMQAALAACNMAKQGGGNCTRIYLKSDSVYQQRQQLVESLPAIKEALAKGRLELFVQPIVPLQSNQLTSHHHEILLRVRNENGEIMSPQDFIEAAETYDLMRDVDRWVVEAFFKQLEPFANQLPDGQSFSINLSGKSLGDLDFKRLLIERIKDTSLETKHFGFEITETALVGDISDTAAAINEIRELGCAFSLDDFGSGYASFSYLKDFPVDYVKIDGIFVREILNKPADYAMISSITEIAHFMEKRVIAEFVSDETTAMALKHMGVDYGQGYHFGKPRPLAEVLNEIITPDKSAVH
ncbi:MAG: DUF1631 family protein [Candidatus Thiodiazotropha lotti]|nr:DUF1631 family protein [Candidatus Thiodiazotropha lotti]MCW4185029.1 DUF1631 family protein [Candidatus Thiodiazotropha weberae]